MNRWTSVRRPPLCNRHCRAMIVLRRSLRAARPPLGFRGRAEQLQRYWDYSDSVVQETLNAREDSGNVVSGAPTVLQDIQTELAVRIYIRMEHLRQEFDHWGLIGVVLVER